MYGMVQFLEDIQKQHEIILVKQIKFNSIFQDCFHSHIWLTLQYVK